MLCSHSIYGLTVEKKRFRVRPTNPAPFTCLRGSATVSITKDGNTVFVLIPKNGCTTLAHSVAGIDKVDWSYCNRNGTIYGPLYTDEMPKHVEIIAFYRDPVDRFVSLCNFVYSNTKSVKTYDDIVKTSNDNKQEFIDKVLCYCMVTNSFNRIECADQHAVSQTRFLDYAGVLNHPQLKIYPISQIKSVLEEKNLTYNRMNDAKSHYVSIDDIDENRLNQIKYTYEKDYELIK